MKPVLAKGSHVALMNALHASLYRDVLAELGNTGTLLPLGDPVNCPPTATTFPGMRQHASGGAQTWTWSEAIKGFDTPFSYDDHLNCWQGLCPLLTFNGTDEMATSPDAAYWTRALAAFSVGAWIRPSTVASRVILSKYDVTAGSQVREWRLYIDSSRFINIEVYDETVDALIGVRYTTAVIPSAQWSHLVATYDGTNVFGGLKIYLNGVAVSVDDQSSGVFVTMRDTTSLARVGFQGGGTPLYFSGGMAGGPLGPFFTQIELTAANVANLYDIGRRALGLI